MTAFRAWREACSIRKEAEKAGGPSPPAAFTEAFLCDLVVNRDATLLAAYRAARAAGEAHERALEMAADMTWESHFDYGNTNRARFMQGNWQKVLLTFRSYSQHMTWFMGRNLYLWTRGESPEVRREARTKFLGLMGMTGMFAGSLGLPMLDVMFGLLNMVAAEFGDDDEPWAELPLRLCWLLRGGRGRWVMMQKMPPPKQMKSRRGSN